MKSDMPDFMLRAVFREPAFQLVLGNFRELASQGIIRHDADPVAGRLLAEALSSAALMTALLGDGERYSILIGCSGPLGAVIVDAKAGGKVRGLVRNPHVMESADSVEVACGDGGADVKLTRSKGGRILSSGESRSAFILPASALGYHLSVSEEHETEIRCEIELRADPADPVRAACGALLQVLPGCDLEEFDRIRCRFQMPEAGEILKNCMGKPEEGMRMLLSFLLERLELPEFARMPLAPARFECGCSAESLKKTAFRMLGREELEKLLTENPNPALRCQFCNTEYHLSAADLH
ncbi:MAG: Hsp33 family molecular chaperone HslO [Lentisphaeria bacterium]|nr:Hsp33 family molecular chaperone HslO [Lentisphaeria bacterium]